MLQNSQRKMKRLYLYVILSCIVTGCRKGYDITDSVKKYFKKENVNFDKKWDICYIIPGGGCSTCISSGFTFLFANKEYFSGEQDRNVVVFTGIISKKLLMRNLMNYKPNDFYSIMDSSNVYFLNSKENKYPLILYLNDGKIERAESQSPGSNALNNLESYFKTTVSDE